MKALVTSDLQLSDIPRDSYRFEVFKRLRAAAKKHEVDTIIILGDLCEEKDRHGAWLVNRCVNEFSNLAELVEVVILKGNHDYVDPTMPFYQFLGHIANVHWIGAPTTINQALFLPHTRNYKEDWTKIDFGEFPLVFAHNTFEGVRGPNGHELPGIPNIFDGAKVISGDVHVPQTTNGIIYVGAPYTVDFGDDYEPRLLLIDGRKVTSIPILDFPQKRLIEMKWPKIGAKGWNVGDIVKVRVNLAPGDYSKWMEIKRAIHKWGEEHSLQIDHIQPMVEDGQSAIRKRSKQKVRTDQEIFKEYCISRGIDERTQTIGLELMEE